MLAPMESLINLFCHRYYHFCHEGALTWQWCWWHSYPRPWFGQSWHWNWVSIFHYCLCLCLCLWVEVDNPEGHVLPLSVSARTSMPVTLSSLVLHLMSLVDLHATVACVVVLPVSMRRSFILLVRLLLPMTRSWRTGVLLSQPLMIALPSMPSVIVQTFMLVSQMMLLLIRTTASCTIPQTAVSLLPSKFHLVPWQVSHHLLIYDR